MPPFEEVCLENELGPDELYDEIRLQFGSRVVPCHYASLVTRKRVAGKTCKHRGGTNWRALRSQRYPFRTGLFDMLVLLQVVAETK